MTIRQEARLAAEPSARLAAPRRPGADLVAVLGIFAVAGYVTSGLWRDPNGRILAENDQDHVFFEWIVANAARTVVDLRDPFFTDFLNAPHGINLMANTSIWALALPLTPLTLLAGPSVAVAVLETLALVGTGLGWYYVLSRHVVASPGAALVGAGFCAFAPGMVAQATGHPNIAGQVLVPFLVLTVARLGATTAPARQGLWLALLVVVQMFVNQEVLLLTALACGLFVLAYAGLRPDDARARLRGAAVTLGVAAAVAGAVLAYPLWVEFAGRQSYHGLYADRIRVFGADLASYVTYSRQSFAGSRASAARVSNGVAEQNTFFGWPLLALLLYAVARLRRRPEVRALATVALLAAVFSLGTNLVVDGHRTRVHLPWLALSRVPLLDSVIPVRFGLVVTAIAGVLIALLVDAGAHRHRLVAVVVAVALLPTAPTPLATAPAFRTPAALAGTAWRRQIPAGGTVLVLPFTFPSMLVAMHWQARAGVRYKLVGGYFLAPGAVSGQGEIGPHASRTSRLFTYYATEWQGVPKVSPADRAAVRAEAVGWHVDTAVLPATVYRADEVRTVADQVYGPGRLVGDVWVWRLS